MTRHRFEESLPPELCRFEAHRATYESDLPVAKLKEMFNRFIDELQARNIGSGIHYTALHLQGFYREQFGYRRGDLPEAEWVSDRTVSLPLSPAHTEADIEDAIRDGRSNVCH